MLANFVLENANAPGTGTVTLAGAPAGRITFLQGFAAGTALFYVIDDGAQAESGYGTLAAGPPATLTRNPVWTSAGGTSPLNFTGAARVFCSLPAERALWAAADNASIPVRSRTLTGLAAGTAVDHAPRLDQVAWERITAVAVSATVTGLVFALPAGFLRYRLEFRNLTPVVAASAYLRYSKDGGSTFIAGASSYGAIADLDNGSSSSHYGGYTSYVQLTPSSANPVFGAAEIDAVGIDNSDASCIDSSGTLVRQRVTWFCTTSGVVTHLLLSFVGTSIAAGTVRLTGARYA